MSYTKSVEIYTAGSGTHSVDGGTTTTSHSSFTWTAVASGSGTISSIIVTGDNYPAWRAIRVDGKILVDAVNDSQVWSAGTVTGDPINTPEKAFDGDLTTGGFLNVADDNASSILTFDTPVDQVKS